MKYPTIMTYLEQTNHCWNPIAEIYFGNVTPMLVVKPSSLFLTIRTILRQPNLIIFKEVLQVTGDLNGMSSKKFIIIYLYSLFWQQFD